MFYETQVKDYVDLSPDLFDGDLQESIHEQILRNYSNKTSEDLGLVITVLEILTIGDGFKLAEDPSRHYNVEFTLLTYKPELHEVIEGTVSSVTNFGLFVNMGIIDGLVHLSQTMVDQVSFSNTGILLGSQTGQTLKAEQVVRASVVAVSFKDIRNVKIGLTMRQPGLGAIEWLEKAR